MRPDLIGVGTVTDAAEAILWRQRPRVLALFVPDTGLPSIQIRYRGDRIIVVTGTLAASNARAEPRRRRFICGGSSAMLCRARYVLSEIVDRPNSSVQQQCTIGSGLVYGGFRSFEGLRWQHSPSVQSTSGVDGARRNTTLDIVSQNDGNGLLGKEIAAVRSSDGVRDVVEIVELNFDCSRFHRAKVVRILKREERRKSIWTCICGWDLEA